MPFKTSGIFVSSFAVASAVSLFCNLASAQEEKITSLPLFHVANKIEPGTGTKNDSVVETLATADPEKARRIAELDRALEIAGDGLQHIRADIRDYSAMMVKRERINGIVGDPEFMDVKIRNRRPDENIPFSIYMNFLKPKKIKGREVIYVEGRNEGKLIAHEGGMIGIITARLDPDGRMAMKGNRYPIYEAGIENLVYRLIEKGNRDRKIGDAEVKFYENTKINKRNCTLIQVKHPVKRPEYDFYVCRVYIDKELNVPIRYAAYDWPQKEGAKPKLEEEYTYLNMKLNIGLTDNDFDPTNSSYSYRESK